jgi:hypothetical protein
VPIAYNRLTNDILTLNTAMDEGSIESIINANVIAPADCVIQVVKYSNPDGLKLKVGLRKTLVIQQCVGHYEVQAD